MAKETKKAAAPKGGEQVKVEGFVPTLQKKYKVLRAVFSCSIRSCKSFTDIARTSAIFIL